MGRCRRRKKTWLLARLAAALLATSGGLTSVAGCGSAEPARRSSAGGRTNATKSKNGVGTPLPAIVVKRLGSKKQIDLAALRGKVLLVDIWASWCAPCMEEMPLLDDLAGRLKSRGVEVIAISIDEDKGSATTFLASRQRWNLTIGHDPDGKVPELLHPPKMPTSYLVDAQGIIRYVNEGFERDDIKRIEKRLIELAETGGSAGPGDES